MITNKIDLAHIAVIVSAFTAYTVLHMTGNGNPSTDSAIFTLASFFAGSWIRSKEPGVKT